MPWRHRRRRWLLLSGVWLAGCQGHWLHRAHEPTDGKPSPVPFEACARQVITDHGGIVLTMDTAHHVVTFELINVAGMILNGDVSKRDHVIHVHFVGDGAIEPPLTKTAANQWLADNEIRFKKC